MLRIIGDVHGHAYRYLQVIENADYSIQVGDFGFSDSYTYLSHVDFVKHKIIAGNHDDYNNLTPHFLGDYGTYNVPDFGNIFFIRGEYSIDKQHRIKDVSWWEQEELNWQQSKNCAIEYEKVKPDFVVAHGCPGDLIPFILHRGSPKFDLSNTAKLLNHLYFLHQPKVWIFGHYHRDYLYQNGHGTTFICLNELSFIDFKTKENHGPIQHLDKHKIFNPNLKDELYPEEEKDE